MNRKIRILIADDHTMMRDGTKLILEGQPDMEVVAEARDGEEAVRMALAYIPDVVILDVTMPKLNGIQVAQQITRRLHDTRVLIVTGYDYEQYLMAALKAGVTGYYLKSASSKQLVDAIRTVANGGTSLQPEVARRVVGQLGKVLKWQQAAPVSTKIEKTETDLPTEREIEIVKGLAAGASNKELAEFLGISPRTVEFHLGNIFVKLGAASRMEAVMKAFERHWLDRDAAQQ